MIKVLNQYFPGRLFVLIVTENMLIFMGIWAAIAIHVGSVRISLLSYPGLFGKATLITVVSQACLYYADIYDLRSASSRAEVLLRVLQALGVASIILATIFYVFPQLRLGSGIVETSLFMIVSAILVWRILVEWVNRAYVAGERVLLVGSGNVVQQLAREVRLRKDLPINLLGSVVEAGLEYSDTMAGIPALGGLDELNRIVESSKPDRLVIALRERRQQLPIPLLLKLRLSGMLVEDASALYEKITGRIPVSSIHPSSLIFSDGFRQSRLVQIYGRMTGFIGAVIGLVFAGPLMLLIAIAIKLDSRGPVFYRQSRVGLNGKTYDVLKFRSMKVDAETQSGPVWAQKADPRITRMGSILRKCRLDELPQFFNVLFGDMSFVGPRPERPFFVDLLKDKIPFYDLRHAVRPGITGWAQVSHDYGATIEEAQQKLEYDLFYIKNMSLSFDFLILFQTIKIVLFGRGSR